MSLAAGYTLSFLEDLLETGMHTEFAQSGEIHFWCALWINMAVHLGHLRVALDFFFNHRVHRLAFFKFLYCPEMSAKKSCLCLIRCQPCVIITCSNVCCHTQS